MRKTLEEKAEHSRQLLSQILEDFGPGAIRVAWTGGKDSTVALHLWRGMLQERGLGPARAINLDTGCKFPEVMAFRDRLARQWGVDLHIARPGVELSSYPLARDKVSCCRDLKIFPLARAVRELDVACLITGIRRDEHPSRASRQEREQQDDPAHLRVNPLLDWTEMDVWAWITGRCIPFCELYGRGYRSLGCVPCTALPDGTAERSGRDAGKDENLGLLTSMGYF